MQALGYRHLCGLMEGKFDRDEAIRTMKRDTRHYAKRQMTWFGSDPRIEWVYNSPEALEDIEESVWNFLNG